MLNKLTILVLLLFCGASATAQTIFKPEWHVGVKGGMSAARVSFNPRVDQSFVTGQVMGVGVTYYSDYFWHAKWGLHLELNKLTKGWSSILEEPFTYKREISYLEVPVFAQSTFGYRHFKVLVNFGPFMAFFQDEKEDYNFTADDVLIDGIPNYVGKATETTFDFGVGGGIGFMKPFSWGSVQLEGRVMQSLMGLYTFTEQNIGSQNQYVEVNFSVYYRLNKNK